MGGVRIVIAGSERQFEALTDDQGVYRVVGLPAGKYTIRPVLPGNLRLERWDGKDFVEAVVPPGGCAAANLTVETNGGVAGRIFDSAGNPAEGIRVDLVPVHFVGTTRSAEVVESKNEKTDKEGRYQFTGISPGRYYLGVNLSNEPTAELPYDSSIYAGTGRFMWPAGCGSSGRLSMRSRQGQHTWTSFDRNETRWAWKCRCSTGPTSPLT